MPEHPTPLTLVQLTAAPAAPGTGKMRVYALNDGKVYKKDSADVQTELGSGGGTAARSFFLS